MMDEKLIRWVHKRVGRKRVAWELLDGQLPATLQEGPAVGALRLSPLGPPQLCKGGHHHFPSQMESLMLLEVKTCPAPMWLEVDSSIRSQACLAVYTLNDLGAEQQPYSNCF